MFMLHAKRKLFFPVMLNKANGGILDLRIEDILHPDHVYCPLQMMGLNPHSGERFEDIGTIDAYQPLGVWSNGDTVKIIIAEGVDRNTITLARTSWAVRAVKTAVEHFIDGAIMVAEEPYEVMEAVFNTLAYKRSTYAVIDLDVLEEFIRDKGSEASYADKLIIPYRTYLKKVLAEKPMNKRRVNVKLP